MLTNFSCGRSLYHSLSITSAQSAAKDEWKWVGPALCGGGAQHKSPHYYQLQAFAEAVYVAEEAWRRACASPSAAADAQPSAEVAHDIQQQIRALVPTDHCDAVHTQRLADSVYVALGMPLRGTALPPATAAPASAKDKRKAAAAASAAAARSGSNTPAAAATSSSAATAAPASSSASLSAGASAASPRTKKSKKA